MHREEKSLIDKYDCFIDILSELHIGMWKVHFFDNAKPKLYVDNEMARLLMIDGEKISPEEAYMKWYNRVSKVSDIDKYFEEIKKRKKAEISYIWIHPVYGEQYVKCGLKSEYIENNGYIFTGYHKVVFEKHIDDIKKLKLAFAKDVKKLKEVKKELETALEKANQAGKTKADFLSRMSHDIRTPINGIKGMLMLSKEYIGNDKKVLEEISKAQDAEETLEIIVNDILDMNKLEQGDVKLDNSLIDIKKLLNEAEQFYCNELKQKKITAIQHKMEIVHSKIYGSAKHLKRILLNIISNCIKYNKVGGTVEKKVAEIPIDDNHSMYSFIIEDTGIGMSEEFVTKIFDPFTKEADDAGTVYKGTGLGMAITKKLVELMGGTISVTSKKDVGTRVEINIPFEIYPGKSCEKNKDISLNGRKILLVEDNELNLEIAEFLLKEKGAQITVAKNGKQAVDCFRSSKDGEFDVIFMDIMMPYMNGYESTKAIRTMDRKDARKVPILAMTANVFAEDVEKAKSAGINAHIAKPIDINRVVDVLRQWVV